MPEKDLSLSVLIALRRIMRSVYLHSRKLETEYRLTGPQQIMLSAIASTDGIPICSLARTVNLSNATTSGIVDRLEKRGLAKRERSSADRRTVLVKLTDPGKETLKKIPPSLQHQFVEEFRKLVPREQTKILRSLESVAVMLRAEQLDVAPVLSGQSLQDNPRN